MAAMLMIGRLPGSGRILGGQLQLAHHAGYHYRRAIRRIARQPDSQRFLGHSTYFKYFSFSGRYRLIDDCLRH